MLHNKPHYLRFALMAPAGDDAGGGSTGGADGAVDRGDDHVATDDDAADKVAKQRATDLAAKKAVDGKTDDTDDKGKYDLDPEEEGDETAEEKAAREAEEAKLAREKNIRVPKWRLDEVQAKAKERIDKLQRQIEELQGANTTKKVHDQVSEFRQAIETLQDKYEDLVLDGKKIEARTVRQQIAQMQDELSEFKSNQKSEAARVAAVDQMKFDVALARLEADHPQLNPDSDQFDQDLTEEVADMTEAFIARGIQRAEALKRAARYVMRTVDAEAGKATDTKEVVEKRRREEARKKAAEAAKRQAPDTTGVGKASDTAGEKGKDSIDVMRMKQKDFAKLDEDTLAKLRGDDFVG